MTESEHRTIKAIVPRNSRDEHTFAVVEANVDGGFGDEQVNDIHALFGGIQQAVTGWSRQTEIGKSVIQTNGMDFNVGDLVEWASDKTLVPFLREQGIQSVSVETFSDTTGHSWEFDDRLIENFQII